MNLMKKNLTDEERASRMHKAMEAKGIDYDEYQKSMKAREEAKKEKKLRCEYHPNHEDNMQFGCCWPDVCNFV